MVIVHSYVSLPEGTLTDQYSRSSKMSQVRDPAAHIAEEPAHAYGSNQAQEAPRVSAKVKNQASAAGRALAVHNICEADGQTVSNCQTSTGVGHKQSVDICTHL